MISCTECKNSGYCPLWKSEKVNIRNLCEQNQPLNYILQMANTINCGEYLAPGCEKFQKNIFSV